MSASIPLPNEPDQDDAYFRAVLLALVDQGAAIARNLSERALENRPDADPTIAFDRVARTIRRTIALARHIAAGKPTHQTTRTAARSSLIRNVEDAIHRKTRTHDGIDVAQLQAEFAETLEDPALEFDLTSRSVDEIVQEICHDLGLDTPTRSFIFKRRTPAERKTLRTRAAQPPAPPSPPPGREAPGEGRPPGGPRPPQVNA